MNLSYWKIVNKNIFGFCIFQQFWWKNSWYLKIFYQEFKFRTKNEKVYSKTKQTKFWNSQKNVNNQDFFIKSCLNSNFLQKMSKKVDFKSKQSKKIVKKDNF